MITKISLIDNIDEEEEKKKKLLGSNFGGNWGISDLVKPEKETEEEKPFKIAKIKPITEPVETQFGTGASAVGGATLPEPVEVPSSQYGISDLNKPEQMGKIQKGAIGIFGTWEAKKKAMPELQGMEDFGTEVFKQGDERNQIAYIQEALTGTPKEETLKELQANWDKFKDINPDIDERTWKEYYKQEGFWKTLITGPSKGKYDEAIKLRNQLIDIAQKVAEPGKDIIGQLGWSGMVAILGTEAVAGIMSVSPIIKEKLLNKTIKTNVSTEKSFKALQDISGRGGTTEQMKLFRTIIAQAKAKGVSVSDVIRKGVTTTETVPRFAFGGAKLYAGLPADEIAKSIVEVGKVTAEAVKGLDPVKVSQVTQALLNTSPVLASEFLKAIEKPEAIPKEEVKEPVNDTWKLTPPQAEARLSSVNMDLYQRSLEEAVELGLPANKEGLKRYAERGLEWAVKALKEEPLKKVTPPAEPKEVLKAEGKEPDYTKLRLAFPKDDRPFWQVTKKEINDYVVEKETKDFEKRYPIIAGSIKDQLETNIDVMQKYYLSGQKKDIQQAIAEGKPVPPEVLADYPDLKAEVKEPEPLKIEWAPKYVKKMVDSLQINPEQHNKDIALDAIKRYLEETRKTYIEYKEKMDKFPELHLNDFVTEYDNIQNFYNKNLKAEPKLPTFKPTEKPIYQAQPAPEAVKGEIPKAGVKEPGTITKDQYNEMLKHYKSAKELPPGQMVASGATYGSMKWQKYEMLSSDLKSQLANKYEEVFKKVEPKGVAEPTPKATPKAPAIPAELEGLAEYKGEGASLIDNKDKEIINKKSLPPNTVFRGVNDKEFENIINTGKIKSAQEYNFKAEQGRTLYGDNYQTAKSYASGFLPSKYRDEFFKGDRINYVIEIANAPELGIGRNREVMNDPTSKPLDTYYATEKDIPIEYIKSITALQADEKGNVSEYKWNEKDIKDTFGETYKPIKDTPREYTVRVGKDKAKGGVWYEVLGDKGEPTGQFINKEGDGINVGRLLPEQIERVFSLEETVPMTVTIGKPTQATAKPAPTKAEVEPEVELATPAQINKAYSIAKSKAMISEEGKLKPQYRKIAEIFTGVKYIEKMTPEQAEMFIDQLNRLPEPKYRNGKLVPPSIPTTTKLTIQGFFQKKYGEPTPIWLLTDQTYYATKLGIKPLVAPFEKGKQEFDLEFRKSSNLVDRMVNKLNQVAKTSMGDRIKSKVKNVPTKAESKMAELVNEYETTPPGLSPKEEDIFKYFRNLSKDIWRRENEVREKLDLPPIKYKTAYFRHTADAMAKEMMEGKYPFPQGVKYWSGKTVGKKIFNPMEFQRKLSDDLIDLWSKDIRAVTKAMLWNGLKEIHLAEPAKYFKEQLNAISKDLPEYKNLTPSEQKAYDQTEVIPASTKKWLIDYINQVLKGQETELDASLNRIVTKSGLKGIFDKVLAPFGRSIGRTPITHLFSLSGRMIISGVMGWVPRQIIRNAFQQVQNLALYGVKATIKAMLPAGIDKNLKGLLNESLFLKSYTGYEELPTNLMAKLEKIWLGPYGIVAVNNAKQGMKAAYWNILELIKNPKFKKYGWADPQRTKDTLKGFLYPSEKEKLLKEMEFGSSCTQYQYIPMGMPGVFRYKALIPLTRLQSWWMNYFTKFNREAIHRGFKGRPSWSGEDGPTLPWSRRVNWLKYLVIGGAILTALGYKRSFMLGVLPVYISPAGQVALGIYNYATANTDWQKKRALNQIYYSWKAFIPGSLAWRDFLAVWNGEKDLNEILFYGKKEEKKPEAITIGKPSVSKITIPKISKIKINKISPTKIKF